MENYIEEFKRIVELKNEGRPCNGRYQDPRFDRNNDYIQPEGQQIPAGQQPRQGLSISKEINRMLGDLERNLFTVDPDTEQRCVQKNCIFIGGVEWKIQPN